MLRNICLHAESSSLAPIVVGAGLQPELSSVQDPDGCCGTWGCGAALGSPLGELIGVQGGGRGGQMLQEKQELIYNLGGELMGHYSVITRSLPILLV